MVHISQRIIRKGMGGALCFTCSLLYAAVPPVGIDGFYTAVHQQPASIGRNAAFMTSYHIDRISKLEADFQKDNADFRNFNQSDNSLSYRVGTASYYRLSPRLMLHGSMEYAGFIGRGMEGSAFISPDEAPFDILEVNNQNKGKKKLETYSLQGALGYDVSPEWSIGGGIRYQAGNYAKYKDLRHKNTLMNMETAVGVRWSPCVFLSVGFSYLYHRRNEAISFNTYGNMDVQYASLISFGNFFGQSEVFGESGYTASTSKRTPLFEQSHEGALQWQLNFSEYMAWFSELSVGNKKGRFGTGQDNMITYTHHKETLLGYRGRWVFDRPLSHQQHVVDVRFKHQILDNFENIYKESTDGSNVSQIIYYGDNQVLKRKEQQVEVAYTFYQNGAQQEPLWQAGVLTSFYHRDNHTVVYPFFRNQDLHAVGVMGWGEKFWSLKSGRYGLRVGVAYGQGGGNPVQDGLYTTPSSDQKPPVTRMDLLMREYEYLTAPRIQGQLSLGYQRQLTEKIGGYVQLAYEYTQAWDIVENGRSAHHFQLGVGCRF